MTVRQSGEDETPRGISGSPRGLLGRLMHARDGNVMMIMAFATIPLTAAVGMSIDYAKAAKLQTKMNSAADAGALAAVTTPMMSKSQSVAAQAAANMFISQVSGLAGMSWKNSLATSPTISQRLTTYTMDYGAFRVDVNDVNLTGLTRTASLTYSALSANTFANVLGLQQSGIGGTSKTTAKVAPNIDFYVLLDTSGSMALPATSSGLTLLTSKTGGCAFACHSSNDATAIDANGKRTDYYGVATSFGIPLRIDEAKTAIQKMMIQATSTSQNNKASYRASLSTFAAADTRSNNYFTTTQTITSRLARVSTAAGNASTSFYYKNGCPTVSFCNNDQDTASSDAFLKMNALMTVPGNGSNLPGDKPQEIMFIISDGMRDEYRPGGRPEVAIDTAWCDSIKARGIRIGVLYTEYLAESLSDGWSKSNVLPRLGYVDPALQNCASTGLYYKVTTDGDITAALNQLFQQAVATARITN